MIYKKLLEDLFYIDRNIVCDGNIEALDRIKEDYPNLQIYKFNSGENVFDWTIPKSWKLNNSFIKNPKGDVILSSNENPLNTVFCSESFEGVVSKDELLDRLHFSDRIPESIPYRQSTYDNRWGFCVQKEFIDGLTDGDYFVSIDSEFKDGSLVAGELVIEGQTKKEVILTSYICHPRQSNDGLSGVIMLLKLYDYLKTLKLKYTYRFFFFPETIGSITLLSKGVIKPKKVEYALVSTCVGNIDSHITYKSTYLNNHSIDNIIKDKFKDLDIRKYFPYGSDERQFSSPGIRIPTAVITGTPFGEFDEYHTSFDDLDFFNWGSFNLIFDVYIKTIITYEELERYVVTFGGCEPMLGKRNLYIVEGNTRHTNTSLIRNWILNMCDGRNSLLDMSVESGYSYEDIKYQADILLKNKLIELI